MEILKDWTTCVCVTLILAVIFSLFAPRGNLNRFYKLIISLFIFVSLIYPFKDTNLNARAFNFDNAFNETVVENSKKESVEIMVENQIKGVLANNGILTNSVIVSAKVNNDEIELNSVEIAIPDDYKIDDVKSLVFDELGINAEVHYIGN